MDVKQILAELDALTAVGIKDLNPEESAAIAATAIGHAAEGRQLSNIEREAIQEYAKLFQQLLRNPAFRSRLKDMIRLMKNNAPKTDTE